MARNIRLKKTGKEIGERIDFLREVTIALLDEVKSLTPLQRIQVKDGINFDEEVRNFEIYLIKTALEQTGGGQVRAARLLKLKHTTLNSKIKRYEISPEDINKNGSDGDSGL